MAKEKAVIAGAALLTAVIGVGGKIVATEVARGAACDYVREAINYEELVRNGTLADSSFLITRKKEWRGVDAVIRELVSAPGSDWANVPGHLLPPDSPYVRIEERPVDIRLPDVYLQRVHTMPPGMTEAMLSFSTIVDRIKHPTQTYVVGKNRLCLPVDTLKRISLKR